MFWIAASVVLALIFWVGVFLRLSHKENPDETSASRAAEAAWFRKVGLAVMIVPALLWIVLSLSLMLHNVGEREVAIVYNFSGTIAGKRDPGVVWTMPWQSIKKENVGIQHVEFDLDANNSAVSLDQQAVRAKLAVNYRVDPAEVVDLYRRVGSNWKEIIVNARVLQDFKEITATYNTPQLTAERAKLRSDTAKRLSDELKDYDIDVIDVFVTNLGFSETYTNAVEAKQKQVQDAQRAQARVAEKTAEANQARAEAQGIADANVIRARGEATANRLRRQTLTPLLVQQSAIDKLNDKVQVIICPPNSVCIPNSPIIPTGGGNG